MSSYGKGKEAGVVLVISMLFLLVITLIGLGAMGTTRLEVLMANNSQFQMEALADAEVALKTGEEAIDTVVSDGTPLDFAPTDRYHLISDTGIDPSLLDWSSFGHATSTNGSKHIIEYGGHRPLPGESGEVGTATAGGKVYLFLVSAQAATARGAVRNVQSVYFTAQEP